MDSLTTITELSHEFGGADYVKGGGGNTSCKNAETLWIKPSGTTLSGLQPETFVAMNRHKINALYAVKTPADKASREDLVKNVMADAVMSGSSGRPSVEAPLHNVFNATFVVHTHPALVNGMTCAKNGKTVCAKLFPEALWIGYIDPGYTLCMHVRTEIETYRAAHNREPSVLFLENHGVFVAADTAGEIRGLYANVIGTLKAAYANAGVPTELLVGKPTACGIENVKRLLDGESVSIAFSGRFAVADGPVTPDHIVYSKSYPFTGTLTEEHIAAFKKKHGYSPRVIVADGAVFGAGASQKSADLALVLAQDGALVQQLAEAFGGLQFMTTGAREFIENWEVESYRSNQMK
ncbi:MAG: class II aldolase [Kiritimatiellaceae bacterium]|nr:class II aldolase [Kiritimatiellaceae bacterium]